MNINNTKMNIMLVAIVIVLLTNFMYNMSDMRFYAMNQNNIPMIELGIILGAIMTIIIEFYGTYLIVQKHIIKN